MAYPRTIGACVDLLWKLQQARIKAAETLKDAKKKEDELETYLIDNFKKDQLKSAKGEFGQVSLKQDETPIIEDFDEFIGWVAKGKRWEFLQRRVAITAVKEHWEAGKGVPGIGSIPRVGLNVSRVKRGAKK